MTEEKLWREKKGDGGGSPPVLAMCLVELQLMNPFIIN